VGCSGALVLGTFFASMRIPGSRLTQATRMETNAKLASRFNAAGKEKNIVCINRILSGTANQMQISKFDCYAIWINR
jgi:hypothetical protein